ncbi:hypothetical protein AZ09_00005, partial [Acetobacter aceti 1023]
TTEDFRVDGVDPSAFIADKAYDADPIIERFFVSLKRFRSMAICNDQLKSTFLVTEQCVVAIFTIQDKK